jgi:hypothetical protein
MKSPARQFFLQTSAVPRPSVKALPLSLLWAVPSKYSEPSTYPFSNITSSQPHKSPRNTTYSSRALMFTYYPLAHVPQTPSLSPTVTAQMTCTSCTHFAVKQRLLTTIMDPFIFLPAFYLYTAFLIIYLPVLCLAFSSSTPHSNPQPFYTHSPVSTLPLFFSGQTDPWLLSDLSYIDSQGPYTYLYGPLWPLSPLVPRRTLSTSCRRRQVPVHRWHTPI